MHEIFPYLNPSCARFILKKHKGIFAFSIILQHWGGSSYWIPPSKQIRTCPSYTVSTMAANGLVMEGARASTAMVLTMFAQNILVSALEGLTIIQHLIRARFLSLAWSKLRLCSANYRPGYWSNLPSHWPSTAWAYSEQETENRPRYCAKHLTQINNTIWYH